MTQVQSPPPAQFRRSRIRVRARIGFALLPPGVAPYAVASAADQACRSDSFVRRRRIRQSLQFDDGRSPVPIPQVDRVAPSGNPTWQGEHLGFFGCPRRVQLGDQRNLVAPELSSFLIEPGGFGPGRVQFAAQLAIAALQYLKKPDVGQAFGMQMVTGPPGIGGLLSKHGRSGDPDFAPREGHRPRRLRRSLSPARHGSSRPRQNWQQRRRRSTRSTRATRNGAAGKVSQFSVVTAVFTGRSLVRGIRSSRNGRRRGVVVLAGTGNAARPFQERARHRQPDTGHHGSHRTDHAFARQRGVEA